MSTERTIFDRISDDKTPQTLVTTSVAKSVVPIEELKQRINKLIESRPKHQSIYAEFPLMSCMFNSKLPEISDTIISYISPYDLRKWSMTTLPAEDYDERVEIKVMASFSLAQSWFDTRNQLKKTLGMGNQQGDEKDTCLPPGRTAQQESLEFAALVESHLAQLKTALSGIHSLHDTELSAARNSVFFLSQLHNSSDYMMTILLDEKLEDKNKADTLAAMIDNGIAFDSSKETHLSWDRKYDCCNYPTNYITCWTAGFVVESTQFSCCCLKCDTVTPVPLTPMLASVLHAGIDTASMVRDIYPNQVAATVQSVHAMKAMPDGFYYRKIVVGWAQKLQYQKEVINRADITLSLLKSSYTEEEINNFFQNASEELAKLTDIKQCLTFYEKHINAIWINQKKPSSWLEKCGLFNGHISAYSKVKIEFIALCQGKLIEYCRDQKNKLVAKDYLALSQTLIAHPVFNEVHCQCGVDNTFLNQLKALIKSIKGHLVSTGRAHLCNESTPLMKHY